MYHPGPDSVKRRMWCGGGHGAASGAAARWRGSRRRGATSGATSGAGSGAAGRRGGALARRRVGAARHPARHPARDRARQTDPESAPTHARRPTAVDWRKSGAIERQASSSDRPPRNRRYRTPGEPYVAEAPFTDARSRAGSRSAAASRVDSCGGWGRAGAQRPSPGIPYSAIGCTSPRKAPPVCNSGARPCATRPGGTRRAGTR